MYQSHLLTSIDANDMKMTFEDTDQRDPMGKVSVCRSALRPIWTFLDLEIYVIAQFTVVVSHLHMFQSDKMRNKCKLVNKNMHIPPYF